MSILPDAAVERLCRASPPLVDPFTPRNLTPNGYDLSVIEVWVPPGEDRTVGGVARVPPLTRFLLSTVERVCLPNDLAGHLWLRTSWARRGVIASFGVVDAGFEGTLTFGAFNAGSEPLEIPLPSRFAQIVFYPLASPAEGAYVERSGHYHGQTGLAKARPEGDR